MMASQSDNANLAKLALKNKADVNQQNEIQTVREVAERIRFARNVTYIVLDNLRKTMRTAIRRSNFCLYIISLLISFRGARQRLS